MVSSFKWVSSEGALANEPMRGVKLALVDAKLIADSIHRGDGQLVPAARRCYYACELTGAPRL
jgi:elongation factor 2